MSKNRRDILITLCGTLLVLAVAMPAGAAYVRPKIGGAQLGHMQAPMIMPEIFFDGIGVRVLNADGQPWPVFPWSQAPILRPLVPPDEFDPNEPWAVLIGKAYNFQYGWDSALLDMVTYPFPPNMAVWIRVLDQSPEIETYFRDGLYAPLFGTPDAQGNPSPDIWMWDLRMRHNTSAVPDTFYGRLRATYEVYLGDAATGDEPVDGQGQPLYESSIVTLRWLRPCPYVLMGDLNYDCIVDFSDYSILAAQWLEGACGQPYWCDECDMDQAGGVNAGDLGCLAENWLIDCLATPENPACTPRSGL